MERVFQIVAVILGAAAGYFLYTRSNEAAFVSIVLACVAFFLSVRFQVKARNEQREAEREKETAAGTNT